MKESLLGLLDLQIIDQKIDVLRRSQTDFPEEIFKLQQELASGTKKLEKTHTQSKEQDKTRRILEGELETINVDLKKHQDRLYEVKTNKEYDALQQEIESLQQKIESHETAILESIEISEDLKIKLNEDTSLFKESENGWKSRIQELTSQLDSVEENVKKRERKRKSLETNVERRPLSIYNRIRKMVKGGVAVVSIEKSSCGGCFRQLSPQTTVEVRRQNQVIRCENCGRILVWKEEVQF